eukprot:TRINITY_DN5404_c3_g3_i1.p1 TRINITY_DN5404_c3_g3~~TRINITY_DN5404_c3_g3_i1.p1  ORF type:complete len:540 (+),score=139.64 TRINITY_DN5404_c3_g3_i1:387-2006(+)
MSGLTPDSRGSGGGGGGNGGGRRRRGRRSAPVTHSPPQARQVGFGTSPSLLPTATPLAAIPSPQGVPVAVPIATPVMPAGPRVFGLPSSRAAASVPQAQPLPSTQSIPSTPAAAGAAAAPPAPATPLSAPSSSADAVPPAEFASGPPWLLHAGRKCDGSVSGEEEIQAFADFVGATDPQKREREYLRMAVQQLVASRVDNNVTVKVVGSVATGTDVFDSALDLCAECGELAEGRARASATELCDAGADAGLIIVPESESSLRIRRADAGSGVSAVLRFASRGSTERKCASILRERLSKIPNSTMMGRVIRMVLRQMMIVNGRGLAAHGAGCLTSHCVTLMIVAFFEHRGRANDPVETLRHFCDFYGNFDYHSRGIRAAGGDGDCVDGLPQGLFPLKPKKDDTLCVFDPIDTDRNVAAANTRLLRIQHVLRFASVVISRWVGSADAARGKSLLFNVISHKGLGQRYFDLNPDSAPMRATTSEVFSRSDRSSASLGRAQGESFARSATSELCSRSERSTASLPRGGAAEEDVPVAECPYAA